jgi:hypothetical protein
MATKKARLREARQRLKTAREQLEQAVVHSWDPVEPAECVTKCFYGFENALTAAATALGEKWTTKHYEKAKLAKQLVTQRKLTTDISDRLTELNDLRKDVQYGDPGAPLLEADLEEIVTELESYLEEVEALIDRV